MSESKKKKKKRIGNKPWMTDVILQKRKLALTAKNEIAFKLIKKEYNNDLRRAKYEYYGDSFDESSMKEKTSTSRKESNSLLNPSANEFTPIALQNHTKIKSEQIEAIKCTSCE